MVLFQTSTTLKKIRNSEKPTDDNIKIRAAIQSVQSAPDGLETLINTRLTKSPISETKNGICGKTVSG